jgi:uncharacterized membrane protein YhhN
MWHLILYALLFWPFSIISTFFKAVRENELAVQAARIKNFPTSLFITIKALPALISVIVIVIFRPSNALFYILLAVALVFCTLGDIGMETKFLVGVGLFLIAQIFFISNFGWHSLLVGITLLPLTAFICAFLAWILVIIFLTHYIESGEQKLRKMKIPLIIYALTVSLTFCSALLLWLTTGVFLGFIPVLGAFFFVISDFAIGIKEFHHHFNKAEVFIFSTYYLAIFLLSLSLIVYVF